MRNNRLVITTSFLLLSAFVCLMSGCSLREDTPIVTINDKNLYIEDFLYDIYTIETEGNRLEEYYQNKLGYSYWDYKYEGSTMREMAKSSVLTQVVMNEILADQAGQEGISLSKKVIKNNENVINQLYTIASEANFNSIGLTREVLGKNLRKVSLSNKYYHELAKDFEIDTEALRDGINRETYREYKTECLFSTTVSIEEDTITPLSTEEKDTAYSVITKALQRVNSGFEFDTILNKEDRLSYSSRNFVLGKSLYEDAYQNAAIVLANGEYSDIVTTDYGYYIIHMLDCYSTDQYEQAVEDAISDEEDKQFAEIYNEIKEQYDITINFEYWDTIMLGSITTLNK